MKLLESTKKSQLTIVALCHEIRSKLGGASILDIHYHIFLTILVGFGCDCNAYLYMDAIFRVNRNNQILCE